MSVDLDTVDWESWDGLPKPGSRVRLSFLGEMVEGVVTPSLAPMADGPQVRVGLWLGGWRDVVPETYVELPFPRDELEVIAEPSHGVWRAEAAREEANARIAALYADDRYE